MTDRSISLPAGGFVVRAGLLAVLLTLTAAPALSSAAAAREAAIVIDAASGAVLYESNADKKNYPASLTKMMTLYLLFEALDRGDVGLGTKLTASKRAAGQPATNLAMRPGDKITVEQAILALIVRSANDVATVVAESLGDTESQFAQMMTRKAHQLGMASTTFRNASGLPDSRQKSTARDLALLARALIYDFPHYYHYFSAPKFTYKGRTYQSHNRLLARYKGADGLKTGYIRASGFNLAASAMRDGRRLIAIVMGGNTAAKRDARMASLLDGGFKTRPSAATTLVASLPKALPGYIPATKPLPPGAVAVAAVAAVATAAAADALPIPPLSPLQLAGAQPAAIPVAQAAGAEPVAMLTPAAHRLEPLLGLPPEPPTVVEAALTEAPAAEDGTLGQLSLGPWGVQVGAFSRFAPAHLAATQATRAVPDLLGPALINIEETTLDNQRIYRARVIGLSEDEAQAACSALKAKEIPCRVVKPAVTLAQAIQ